MRRRETRDKDDQGLRDLQSPKAVIPEEAVMLTVHRIYSSCAVEVDPDPLSRGVHVRKEQEARMVCFCNCERVVRLKGLTPMYIIVDTGANRMVMGKKLALALETRHNLWTMKVR